MNASTNMKTTHNRLRWFLAAGFILLVIALLRFGPSSKMDTAQRIVKEIKAFQTANNRLPDSLTEVGEKANSTIHYQKLDDRSFKVWYEANSQENQVYDSVTDAWFLQR
jgi:hypothetical protein